MDRDMKNWDDLRLFLATARAGSTRGAARALDLNQSTISRRIRQLEARSSSRLFDRRGRGLTLTDAGEELLELAAAIEGQFATVDRRLQGRDVNLVGAVRLSMPDMMVRPTAEHLARFAARYPRIEVEVMVDNGLVSLTHREADLVLRLAKSPPEQLVGRRVAPARVAIYGAEAYLQGRRGALDPSEVDWVRWDASWRLIPMERWIDDHVAPAQIRASAPMDFGLVLWLLTHEDLKRTARVRALMRFLGDALSAERGRFEGA